MDSHRYRPAPGLVLPQEQGMSRVIKDCQPCLPCQGARQEVLRSDSFNLKSHHSEKQWKPFIGLCESNQFVKLDSAVARPVLIDVQGFEANQFVVEH